MKTTLSVGLMAVLYLSVSSLASAQTDPVPTDPSRCMDEFAEHYAGAPSPMDQALDASSIPPNHVAGTGKILISKTHGSGSMEHGRNNA